MFLAILAESRERMAAAEANKVITSSSNDEPSSSAPSGQAHRSTGGGVDWDGGSADGGKGGVTRR